MGEDKGDEHTTRRLRKRGNTVQEYISERRGGEIRKQAKKSYKKKFSITNISCKQSFKVDEETRGREKARGIPFFYVQATATVFFRVPEGILWALLEENG